MGYDSTNINQHLESVDRYIEEEKKKVVESRNLMLGSGATSLVGSGITFALGSRTIEMMNTAYNNLFTTEHYTQFLIFSVLAGAVTLGSAGYAIYEGINMGKGIHRVMEGKKDIMN